MNSKVIIYSLFCIGFLCQFVYATSPTMKLEEQRLIQQEQRTQERDQLLQGESPNISLFSSPVSSKTLPFIEEKICFPFDKIEINGIKLLAGRFKVNDLIQQAQGRCLGQHGIGLLMTEIQNRLISQGYLTSRVVVPEQDLTEHKLQLHIIEGVLQEVRLKNPQYIWLGNAFMIKKGALLNLRDVEQGLENLKRFPDVAVNIDYLAGDQLGQSILEVSRNQRKPFRINLNFDNSGSRNTGRYQGSGTLFLDNPLALSDMLYYSYGQDTHHNSHYGSKNHSLHYSIPFGYWLFSANYSRNNYHQTIAGPVVNSVYSGKSYNSQWRLSRVVYRDEKHKSSLHYTVLTRNSKSYINGSELEVQHRKTSAWRINASHRYFLDNGTINLDLAYQQGTRWFKSIPALEEMHDEGTALAKIITFTASLDKPFVLGPEPFNYQLKYYQQKNLNDLTQPDRISIGSMWNIRGYDGELTLSGDRGWYLQNTLTWQNILFSQNLYLALDYGEVGGTKNLRLVGKHLAGGAIGINGAFGGLYYDVFAGTPLSKPENFTTSSAVIGFNLTWVY